MTMRHPNLQKGYSFIEVLLILSITGILFGFITINLLNAHRQTSKASLITTLTTDLKSQQFKTMTGTTGGQMIEDNYGIYIGPTFYTLFHGSVYNAADTSNLVVNSENNIQLTTTFPSSIIVFQKGSGEIKNYNSSANTITLFDTTNNTNQTITINKYGIITQIQ